MPPKASRKPQGKLAAAIKYGTAPISDTNTTSDFGSNVASILNLPFTLSPIPSGSHVQVSKSNAVVDNRRQSTAHTQKLLRVRDPLKAPSGSAETPETLLSHEMMIF